MKTLYHTHSTNTKQTHKQIMHYAIKSKTCTGATHIKYIYPDQKIRCTFKTCYADGEYIDFRTLFLDGSTVEQALNLFTYADANNEIKKYRISDLKYDLKIGRLEIV